MTITISINSEEVVEKILNRLDAIEKNQQEQYQELQQGAKTMKNEVLKHSTDLSKMTKNLMHMNKSTELLMRMHSTEFVEKLVKECPPPPSPIMATPNGPPSNATLLPPWLQTDNNNNNQGGGGLVMGNHQIPQTGENLLIGEILDCCKDLEEGHRAWVAHKKETAWRLRRVELQLESEKANRRREKIEEIESKVKALWEEQKLVLDRIECEYREQLAGLRKDAEAKEQKLTEQWAEKHLRVTKILEQTGHRQQKRLPV